MSGGNVRLFESSAAQPGLLTRSGYNLVMGAVLVYGFAVNAVLCALFGNVMRSVNPLVVLIAYTICMMIGVQVATRSKDPRISFLGYNLIVIPMGLTLSRTIAAYGGVDSPVVMQACVMTAVMTCVMTAAATIRPDLFAGLGKTLGVCLLALFVAGILQLLLRRTFILASYFGAGVFSLYIGYDFYRSQQVLPTVDNAVGSAMSLYMDIINLLLRLIHLAGRRRD